MNQQFPILVWFSFYSSNSACAFQVWTFRCSCSLIFAIDVHTENVLFPSLMGKSLQLSPAFLFLALLYWNFVFGFGGMLLSILLTIRKMLLRYNFHNKAYTTRKNIHKIMIHLNFSTYIADFRIAQ